MALQKLFAPQNPIVKIYKAGALGEGYTTEELQAPQCVVEQVYLPVAKENGTASILLNLGVGLVDTDSTGTAGATLENFKGTSTRAYINSLKDAWVKIYAYESEGYRTETTGGFPENLPAYTGATPPFGEGDSQKCIFIGRVGNVHETCGQFTKTVRLVCEDIGGWMSTRRWDQLLKVDFDPTSGEAEDFLMCNSTNLPDFNPELNGSTTGNRYIAKGTKELTYVGFDAVSYNLYPFCGFSTLIDNAPGRDYWTGYDIVELVFDYIKQRWATLLTDIGVTLDFDDRSGQLVNYIPTFSPNQYFWNVLMEVLNRMNGVSAFWEYTSTTATFVITGPEALDDAIDYTRLNSYPVQWMDEQPVITENTGDRCSQVIVKTKPTTVVYTWSLGDQFYPGWSVAMSGGLSPENMGGTAALENALFNMKLNRLYKATDGAFYTSPVAETWNPFVTAVGIQFDPGTSDIVPINTIADAANMPYEETCEILTSSPIGSTDEDTGKSIKTTPLMVFLDNFDGTITVLPNKEEVNFQASCLANTLTLTCDEDNLDYFADQDFRLSVYVTAAVRGTPPLYVIVEKEGVGGDDCGIIEVEYPHSPVFVFANTIVKADTDGTAVPYSVAGAPGDFIGTTAETLYDGMINYGEWLVREKTKINWGIKFVEPEALLGKWVSSIEVPQISEDPTTPAYETLSTAMQITSVTHDFVAQTTSYNTDFAQYVLRK